DVAAKILAFAQQRPRALCILSGSGSVSAVTLRQPTNTGGTVTYEGRFEILCLSGSYLVAESGGPRNRTGGISISVCSPDGHMIGGAIGGKLIAANLVQGRFEILCLSGSYLLAESGGPRNRTGGISISVCSPDGHMIGGAIGGKLIAANPVQVVACSFVYGGTKAKNKADSGSTDEKYLLEQQPAENSSTPLSTAPTQNLTPNSGTSVWPLGSRLDVKSSQGGIDLMRG
ncbi:UNVERIFIED_CONTAM: AT-hook motif nuclear-localized protein 5, partial [Sesamum indicum]